MISMPARKPIENLPRQVRRLVEKLTSNSAAYSKVAAASELGESGHPDTVVYLGRALQDDKDLVVRREAAEALGKIGHESAIPYLTSALQDEESSVKHNAAFALGQIGRAIQKKKVREKEAKALQLVGRHFQKSELPVVVRKAYLAALKGTITPENARLYVKQLRALHGSVK